MFTSCHEKFGHILGTCFIIFLAALVAPPMAMAYDSTIRISDHVNIVLNETEETVIDRLTSASIKTRQISCYPNAGSCYEGTFEDGKFTFYFKKGKLWSGLAIKKVNSGSLRSLTNEIRDCLIFPNTTTSISSEVSGRTVFRLGSKLISIWHHDEKDYISEFVSFDIK